MGRQLKVYRVTLIDLDTNEIADSTTVTAGNEGDAGVKGAAKMKVPANFTSIVKSIGSFEAVDLMQVQDVTAKAKK